MAQQGTPQPRCGCWKTGCLATGEDGYRPRATEVLVFSAAALRHLRSCACAVALISCALVLWAGCHALQEEADLVHGIDLSSPWDENRLLEDLRFLQNPGDSDAAELPTDEAAYLVAQVHGLQPALKPSAAVHFVIQDSAEASLIEGRNVMAFAAGAHPVYASELIIVCTGLDGPSPRLGLAALAEIARNYGMDVVRGFAPDRTIMVAAFARQDADYAGLRAYLRQPLWPLAKTRVLIYLDPPNTSALESMLGAEGIVLHVLAPDPSPADQSLPDAAGAAAQLAKAADALLRQLAKLE